MHEIFEVQLEAEMKLIEVTEDLAHIALEPITAGSILLGWCLYSEALSINGHPLAPFALEIANSLEDENLPDTRTCAQKALGKLDGLTSLDPMNLVRHYYDFDKGAEHMAENFFRTMAQTKTREQLDLIPPEDILATIRQGLPLCA